MSFIYMHVFFEMNASLITDLLERFKRGCYQNDDFINVIGSPLLLYAVT